jgi:hypothetical protein
MIDSSSGHCGSPVVCLGQGHRIAISGHFQGNLEGSQGNRVAGRKDFFFEKKQQKTFDYFGCGRPGRASPDSQKSFGAFFVTAQVWRSPPRKAKRQESGSFLKKRTKKL